MQLLDIPSDCLTKIFTDHSLGLRDLMMLNRTSKSVQQELERQRIQVYSIRFFPRWATETKQNFVRWFGRHARFVQSVDMAVHCPDDWGHFMRMLKDWPTERPPRLSLVLADDAPIMAMRDLAVSGRLPPVHELLCAADTFKVARKFFQFSSAFPELEVLTFEGDLTNYKTDAEPGHTFDLVKLPPRLRSLHFCDEIGAISLAVAPLLPPTLESLTIHLTAEVIRLLPRLPRLIDLNVTGEIEADDLMLLLKKCPALKTLTQPALRIPVFIRDIDLVSLPPDVHSFACRLQDSPTSFNPLWASNVETATIYFDVGLDEPLITLPPQLARSKITNLSIRSRVDVQIPDIRESRIRILTIASPRAYVYSAAASTIIWETYSSDLSMSIDSDQE